MRFEDYERASNLRDFLIEVKKQSEVSSELLQEVLKVLLSEEREIYPWRLEFEKMSSPLRFAAKLSECTKSVADYNHERIYYLEGEDVNNNPEWDITEQKCFLHDRVHVWYFYLYEPNLDKVVEVEFFWDSFKDGRIILPSDKEEEKIPFWKFW